MSTQQDNYLPFALLTHMPASSLADTPTTRWAIAHWRQARQTFNQLLSLAPGARQAIDDLLRDTFVSDPQHTGLLFNLDNTSHFVNLTQLCIFTQHHPVPPGDLDRRTRVQGKPGANPKVIELRPRELYVRLAALDPAAAIRRRWLDYWKARAKGTALSKREHARRQYRSHFMATLEIALDQGKLTPAEQRPVLGLLENSEWRVFDAKQVQIDAPSYLPGALIISLEGEPIQLLYAPAQPQAFSGYATRAALETALAGDRQDPPTYTALDTIEAGFEALLEQLQNTLLDTLAHAPGAILEHDASSSLNQVDLLEQSWRNSQVFAEAPADAFIIDPDDSRPTLFDFGSLGQDLAPTLRRQMISRQLELLDNLPAHKRQQRDQYLATLAQARQTATAGVARLSASAKWHSDAIPTAANTALTQAHTDGLLAHARLLRLLEQLDDEQLGWVESVVDGRDSEAVVAQVELLPAEDETQAVKSILPGALVITSKADLASPDAPQSLLFYWIGEHGGLLRCASRQQLEQCLGTGHAVQLHTIPTGAIGQALNALIQASRQEKDTLQASEGIEAVAAVLPRLRETLALRLQVPRHAAREAALQLHAGQAAVITRTGALISDLEKIPTHERQALRTLVNDYLEALRKAHALIQRDLPDRQAFCLRLINRRFRQDFDGFDNDSIRLDLPLSTAHTGRDLVAGSGAPGTPLKALLEPSKARETLPIETLLLEHIDDTMYNRLRFMQLLPGSADTALRQRLQEGIDADYLRALANELDLAQGYEASIINAFMGIDESDFMQAFRRESLVEPHRLILQLQNLLFHACGHLDSTSQAMLAQVIDARSKADYQANGRDLRLLCAHLTSGGPDTNEQPTTLTGITFIEDRIGKTTVLYRPDHPTNPLRQFPDLESARLSLFEDSIDSRECDYLANRALQGKPAAHRSRLNQAHDHHFDGIIGIGIEWPATKSLAELQLDSHMGQLLQAHRNTSRSNLDLHLENLAAQAGKLLLGFKVALGVIPVLGLPVSLYDLYDASAELVKTISEGGTRDVLDALQTVLASVIDVGMDLLGGGAGISTAGLRKAATRYQLRQPLPLDLKNARGRLLGLGGYQMNEPISLDGLPVASEGPYRGVYRTPQGTVIQSHGQPYKVQWDETSRTWELSGNTANRFRRAIALDENGNWDTHFALYGVHRLGGGSGGGQALGQLADSLDPLWPAAVRERLPRWWRDQAYRRHNRLRDSIAGDMPVLKHRSDTLNARMKRSFSVEDANDPSLTVELQGCLSDAKRIHAACMAFSQASSGRLRHNALAQANDLAMLTCDSHNRLGQMAQLRLDAALADVDKLRHLAHGKSLELLAGIGNARFTAVTEEILALRARMARTRAQALKEVDDIRQQVEGMREWRRKVKQTGERREVFKHIDSELGTFTDHVLDYLEIGQLIGLLTKPVRSLDGGWINLQHLMRSPRADLDRALYALHQLANARASTRQRSAILTGSFEQIQQFRNRLRYWQASYAEQFDLPSVGRFENALASYEHYFKGLRQNAPPPAAVSRKGKSQPRVFETSEHRFLIGEPDLQQSNTYRITGVNGRTEIYRQDASGKFNLTNPDTGGQPLIRQATVAELQTEAQRHLDDIDAFTRKIERYAGQGMDGASLEDLMQFKASDLGGIATRIGRERPQDPLLPRLRSAAAQLLERGRQIRIDHIMQTREPNGGQLEYLAAQDAVSIEKHGALVELRRTAEGRRDFLQEFIVRDKRQLPAHTLWYAHVHFNKEAPTFEDFVKAHLKTPSQRYLGREWQDSHVEVVWRGDLTRPQAVKHLSAHF
ncbi:dermonecrotic toxin domain-containing protein [Pseudomonas sp. CAM1A]|uniref:dermonecrotic toxin domain-containing protein n=1 Tax=Pseudomonas sp. CAM1A TaxID=3231717 RepID=UPI0039C6C2DC